jgi:hypothetical protein
MNTVKRGTHAGSVCNTLSLWLWVETLSYPDQNSVSQSDFLLNTELELSLITHYITLSTRVVTESDVFSELLPPLQLSFSTTHLPFLNREGKKNQKHWITVTQFKQKGRNHMIFQLINMYNRYWSKLLENPLFLGVLTRNVEVLVRSVEETRFSSVKEILTTAFWSLSPTKLCA